jgi:hypothetical protein
MLVEELFKISTRGPCTMNYQTLVWSQVLLISLQFGVLFCSGVFLMKSKLMVREDSVSF